MNDWYCIVEGLTEQSFVREVLAPFVSLKGTMLFATRIGTPGHKGGNVTFRRFSHDVQTLLCRREDTGITSMLDFFRLDANWPGMESIRQANASGRTLEPHEIQGILRTQTREALKESVGRPDIRLRCLPYFSMHEFEALLFSDTDILSQAISRSEHEYKELLHRYHDDPEQINTDPRKAPSKIILRDYPCYRKTSQGVAIAKRIGMQRMLGTCSCFREWVGQLATEDFTCNRE